LAGAAARQPRRAARCAEQVEARRDERHLSQEGFSVEHDGSRREGRPGVVLGAAMTLTLEVAVKDRRGASTGLIEKRPTQTAFLIPGSPVHSKEVDLGS